MGDHVTLNGSLILSSVGPQTTGDYKCINGSNDRVIIAYSVTVAGPPAPPYNLTCTEIRTGVILRWKSRLGSDYLNFAKDTVLHLR